MKKLKMFEPESTSRSGIAKGLDRKIDLIVKEYLQDLEDQLNEHHEEIEQRLSVIEKKIQNFDTYKDDTERQFSDIDQRLLMVEENVRGLNALENDLKKHNEDIDQRLLTSEENVRILNSSREDIKQQTVDINQRLLTVEENIRNLNESSATTDKKISLISETINSCNNEVDAPLDETQSTENFFNKRTYSQAGEDSIILYYLLMTGTDITSIRYLDLGANHAKTMSNTYAFYERGGSGVLVDANAALVEELKNVRSRDTVLRNCIDTEDGKTIKFYVLNGDGLSSPDYNHVQEVLKTNKELKIDRIEEVETISVNTILGQYFRDGIDVMNIDIEGKDEEILRSIDFNTHRPKVIIIEMIPYRTGVVVSEKDDSILEYMNSIGYKEYAFTGINSIFVDFQK